MAEKKSEFKIGDRVRVKESWVGRGWQNGTVVGFDAPFVMVRDTDTRPEPGGWYPHNLEKLPPVTPELHKATFSFMAAVEKVIDDACKPVPGTTPAHDGKLDTGKLDYTLLPAEACAYVLETARDWPFDDHVDDQQLADAAEALFRWRAGGDREELVEAFFAVASYMGSPFGVGAFAGVVDVLTFGAKKYSRDSWQSVPKGLERYWSAAMRHLETLASGEENDGESGHHHGDHLLTNVLFLVHLSDMKNVSTADLVEAAK